MIWQSVPHHLLGLNHDFSLEGSLITCLEIRSTEHSEKMGILPTIQNILFESL